MSNSDWWPIIASASGGGGLIGVIGTRIFDWGRNRSEVNNIRSTGTKIDAEAAQVIADTALTLVAPLKREIQELNSRVDRLEKENAATELKLHLALEHIRVLYAWIFNHMPDKTPPRLPSQLEV